MAFRIKPKSSGSNLNLRYKKAGEIRKSQLITTYGPGSLVDFPRMSGIINGIDNWESTLGKSIFKKMVVHERNLERILCKKYFIQPQYQEDKNITTGITVERFPQYCYCPECGALDKYYKIEKKSSNTTDYNQESYCGICYQKNNRNVKLIPSRFVISCECGHMSDFPYEWWVHRKKGKCESPKLSIEISKITSTLEGINIKCECGAKENLEGIMDKGALYERRCFGDMPWLGRSEDNRSWYSDINQEERCEEALKVLQRGANNVYYPEIKSALTIPPYSSRVQKILNNDIEKLEDYFDKSETLKEANLKDYYERNKGRLRCDWNKFNSELKYALGEMNSGYNNFEELMKGEYDALCDEDCNDPDFLTVEMDVPEEFIKLISQIKIVGRLREVQVLDGFRRINPESLYIAPLARKSMDWLPANELYGEGIFIKLDEERVYEWEKTNSVRYKNLVSRSENYFKAKRNVASDNLRYILLHTLAHLLIRELSVQCGYSSASIKEKIYSSNKDSMCGILIYTASSDTDGSLGGLARQGVTEKIKETLFAMLENASWCSNDPVCIDSISQGYQALNYAACHACTLLPETSCECSSILLDRGAIVGTSDNKRCGYFSELLEKE